MDGHDISAPWARFIAAYRAGEDYAALGHIQEFIRTWDDAFWANDFRSFPEVYTDDVVLTNSSRLQSLVTPPQAGIEGFPRLREDIVEVARFFRFDVQGLRRGNDDRVVAVGRLRAASRYAGIIGLSRLAIVWTLRGDKICRAEGFTSQRSALKEAGVRDWEATDEKEWEQGGLDVGPPGEANRD